MTTVHEIAGCPEDADVLLWDAHEKCWVVGHQMWMQDIEQWYYVALRRAEAYDRLIDGEPLPVLARCTHWAPLPPPIEGK